MTKPTNAKIREWFDTLPNKKKRALHEKDIYWMHELFPVLLKRLEAAEQQRDDAIAYNNSKDWYRLEAKLEAAEQTIKELRTELELYNGVIDT